jgi:hypothetical protein
MTGAPTDSVIAGRQSRRSMSADGGVAAPDAAMAVRVFLDGRD